MRRTSVIAATSVLMVVAVALVACGKSEQQSAGPEPAVQQPLVGSWVNDIEPDNPNNPPSLITFHADGTVRDWNVNPTGVGVWESTGERSFAGTILYPIVNPQAGDPGAGFVGFVTTRIVGQVSGDGQTADGTYTLEFPDAPAGMFPPPGEYGPAAWTATRIVVKPMGEPVGPLPLPTPPSQ